jgi:Uma2 family endonuclease
MAFTIKDAWLPATLTAAPMTDEEFAALVAEHPDLSFEMSADGELIVMPPNYSTTGARNARIVAQLFNWAERDQRGTAFDSSTGFVFPNGARRSPDASWVLNQRIGAEERSREGYLHLCPDFAIELRSESDRLRVLREKMKEYIDNGAQLAWLIDPLRQAVEIFRPGRAPEISEETMMIEGENPVGGFTLELQRVWKPWQ